MWGCFIKSTPLAIAFLFFALAGWSRFSRREGILLGVAGLFLAAWLLWLDTPDVFTVFGTIYLLLFPAAYYWVVREFFSKLSVRAENREKNFVQLRVFLWIGLMAAAILVVTMAMLRLNAMLLTLTHDLYLYKIDAAFLDTAQWIAQIGKDYAGPQKLTLFVYTMLGSLLFPLLALLVRDGKIRELHGWRTFLAPYLVASLCYAWLPASGPTYAIESYPLGISSGEVQTGLLAIASAPRNAMPSLHLSSAIWIFMLVAALHRKWLRALAALFVIGTAWATLALGEHYVIDLVVALPFSTALGVWLISPPNWKNDNRGRQVQWAAAATFVAWMLLLRLAPEWLAENLGFVRAFSVWSVVVACWLLGRYLRCVSPNALQDSAQPVSEPEWKTPSFLPNELRGNRWLVGIFFFSGFAGLVYEVVYAKALGVTFGGTALAANTVLMTYMGGMALGAWLGGVLAERSRQPLLLYAMFEAAIGLYAAITPFLFSGIQTLYVAVATDSPPDAAWLTVLRMGFWARPCLVCPPY